MLRRPPPPCSSARVHLEDGQAEVGAAKGLDQRAQQGGRAICGVLLRVTRRSIQACGRRWRPCSVRRITGQGQRARGQGPTCSSHCLHRASLQRRGSSLGDRPGKSCCLSSGSRSRGSTRRNSIGVAAARCRLGARDWRSGARSHKSCPGRARTPAGEIAGSVARLLRPWCGPWGRNALTPRHLARSRPPSARRAGRQGWTGSLVIREAPPPLVHPLPAPICVTPRSAVHAVPQSQQQSGQL